MTSQYKLTYFNLRARAELARFLFAAAEVPYADIRIEHSRWPAAKPDTPFGQLPVLEVDGVKICQSLVIARYLANKFGLAGHTELDRARADMIVDCLTDASMPVIKMIEEKDSAKQTALQKKFENEELPGFMEKFNKLLVANKGGDEYFVGDSMTWADIAFANGCSWWTSLGLKDPLEDFPKLKALVDRVESQPRIAEWIRTRPKTAL